MKLSQVLADQVPSQSRARGHAYFRSGAVRSLTARDGIVAATVRGSELYDVWLEPAGDLLRASCTCPYFIDHCDVCKHVWAVILAAEAQAVPLLTSGIASKLVDFDPVLPDDVDLDDEDDDDWTHVVAAPAPRRERQAPPAWRAFIDTVSAGAPAIPGPQTGLAAGQLIYVIDIAGTTASDTLVIELMTRDRKVNGDWAKPKPARLTMAAVATMPDPADRDILERLSGARPQYDWGGYSGSGQDLSRVQLRGVMITDVVPRACATGRCSARISAPHAPPSSALAPLAWDDGPPWTFAVGVEAVDSGYAIEGWLRRDGERIELTDALVLLADGILFTATHAARLSHGGAINWLTALRRAGRVTVPASARDELADALLLLGPLLASVPDDLRVETVSGEPRPHLRIRPPSHRSVSARPDRLAAELAFEYDGTLVDPDSPGRIVRLTGTQRAIRRDLDAERRALEALLEQGARNEWNYHTGRRALQLPSSRLPRAVRQLLDEGWH